MTSTVMATASHRIYTVVRLSAPPISQRKDDQHVFIRCKAAISISGKVSEKISDFIQHLGKLWK